jgi:hypothetical protein
MQIFCTLKCVYIFGGPSVVLYVGINIDNTIYDLFPIVNIDQMLGNTAKSRI